MKPLYSLIIPVKNEEKNIDEIFKNLQLNLRQAEAIFVEGESNDFTWRKAKKYNGKRNPHGIKFFTIRQKGKGKSEAVSTGFDFARGKYLIIVDADLSIRGKDIEKILKLFFFNGDNIIATGNRLKGFKKPGGFYWLNYIGNYFFKLYYSIILREKILDIFCGSKAMTKESWDKIKKNKIKYGILDRWGDVSWLYYGKKSGAGIKFVNVDYHKRVYEESKLQGMTTRWRFAFQVFTAGFKIIKIDIQNLFNQSTAQRWGTVFALIFSLCLILLEASSKFVNFMYGAIFSTDSWGYYDISKNLFTDFYKVDYIRQLQYNVGYSISFPPLYPFFISLYNLVFSSGIYAGYFLNFIFFAITFILSILLFKKITGFILPGILIGILLINNNAYVGELISARSIPLSLLLFLFLLLVLTSKKILDKKQMIFVGLICGLLCMNRFDFLLFGLSIGIYYYLIKRIKLQDAIVYYLVFFAVISPWTIYSLVHFGTFFISDNQRTVQLSINNYTLDYFPKNIALPQLSNNPVRWLFYRGFFKGFLTFLYYIKGILVNSAIGYLISLNTFLVFIIVILGEKFKIKSKIKNINNIKNVAILLPLVLIQIGTISLTSFLEERYIVVSILYLYILLLLAAIFLTESIIGRKYTGLFISVFVLCITFTNLINSSLVNEMFTKIKAHQFINNEHLYPNKKYLKIATELKGGSKTVRLLAHGVGKNTLYAAEFSVLTGTTTVEPAGNVNPYILTREIIDFNITHVNTTCTYWIDTIKSQFNIKKLPNNIYKIEGVKKNIVEPPVDIRFDFKYRDCTGHLTD